jgi:excisionase family DNA binding protein
MQHPATPGVLMKSPAHLAPLDPAQRYSINEATAYLRISRPSIYARINSGALQIIKDGRRTFVPGSEIARLSSVAA